MKNNNNHNSMISLNPLKPTINSSLGHLAFGHLAFKAWRELKTSKNEKK